MPEILNQDDKTVTIKAGDGQPFVMPRSVAESQGIVAQATPAQTKYDLPKDEPGLESGLGALSTPGLGAAVKDAAQKTFPLAFDDPRNKKPEQPASPQPSAASGPLGDLPGAAVQAPQPPKPPALPAGPGMAGPSLDDKALIADQVDRAKKASDALDAEQQLAVKEGRELDDAKLQHIGRTHGLNEQTFALAREHMQQMQDQTDEAIDAVHQWSAANKKTIMSGPGWEQALTVIGGILTLGISTSIQQSVLDREVSHAAENVLKQSGALDTLKGSFDSQDKYMAAMKIAENDIMQNAVDYVTQTHSSAHIQNNAASLKAGLMDKLGKDRLGVLQAVQKDKLDRTNSSIESYKAQTDRMHAIAAGAGAQKPPPPEQQEKIAELNAAVTAIDEGIARHDKVGPEAFFGSGLVKGTKASEYNEWRDRAAMPVVSAIRGGPPRTVEEANKLFDELTPSSKNRKAPSRDQLLQLKAQIVAKRGALLKVMNSSGTSTEGLAPKDVGFKAGR